MTFTRIHNHENDTGQDKGELYSTAGPFNISIPLPRDQINTPINPQDLSTPSHRKS
jgi:hypothetical protein